MDELERRIYAQQCNALARGDLELYEVLKEAGQALSVKHTEVKVIIERGCVQDILKTVDASCSVEVVCIDPNEPDYDKMRARGRDLCRRYDLVSIG